MMIFVKQINDSHLEKVKKTLLITYKCVVLARVLHLFFYVEADFVLNLFLNFE